MLIAVVPFEKEKHEKLKVYKHLETLSVIRDSALFPGVVKRGRLVGKRGCLERGEHRFSTEQFDAHAPWGLVVVVVWVLRTHHLVLRAGNGS